MNENLLLLSIVAPWAIALILAILPKIPYRGIAAVAFLLPGVISIYLYTQYLGAEKGPFGYAFLMDIPMGLETFGISLKLGLNGAGSIMYLMAGVIGAAAGLHTLYAARTQHRYLALLLLVMHGGLMGVFASVDIFYFYFFHEIALIPTFIMIGIWGARNRWTVAMEMTIYLTLGAMLSLAGLIVIYCASPANSFDLISLKQAASVKGICHCCQPMAFGLLMFGFGILVSLFPFHTWAPRGYYSAPTPVSMLHAGVLKKFGLYGLVQIALPLLSYGAMHWQYTLAWLAIGNIIIIGLVTIAQTDLKMMVSYSSVMHMGYCFLGIAALNQLGSEATLMLMFAHGVSVALLFLLGSFIYKRTGSFEMKQMGGMYKTTPVLATFFIAATMASIGLPGFANFWGEFLVFLSLWQFDPIFVFLAVTGIIISAIYGLRSVAWIFFGKPGEVKPEMGDLNTMERIPALILLFALLFVGFWPKSVGDHLHQPQPAIQSNISDSQDS